MIVTIDDILKLRPCAGWTRERMEEITDKREMDLLDVLDLRGVHFGDRIWLAIQYLPEVEQRTFAIWCARRCKTDVPEIEAYIDAIEAYYVSQTGTLEQMQAAYSAADRAAYCAADWAAERQAQLRKLRAMITARAE